VVLVFFFLLSLSSSDCLKALAKMFVGSAVAYRPTTGLMLGAIKDTAFSSTFLGFYLGEHCLENA